MRTLNWFSSQHCPQCQLSSNTTPSHHDLQHHHHYHFITSPYYHSSTLPSSQHWLYPMTNPHSNISVLTSLSPALLQTLSPFLNHSHNTQLTTQPHPQANSILILFLLSYHPITTSHPNAVTFTNHHCTNTSLLQCDPHTILNLTGSLYHLYGNSIFILTMSLSHHHQHHKTTSISASF